MTVLLICYICKGNIRGRFRNAYLCFLAKLNLALRTCFSYFNEEFFVLGWDFFLYFMVFVCLFFGGFFSLLQKEHIVAYLGLHLSLNVKHVTNRS